MNSQDSIQSVIGTGEAFQSDPFSVVTPTFRRVELITETPDSVLAQSSWLLEIVIVTDGSTDATRDVVNNWISKNAEDKSLKALYVNQYDSGSWDGG